MRPAATTLGPASSTYLPGHSQAAGPILDTCPCVHFKTFNWIISVSAFELLR